MEVNLNKTTEVKCTAKTRKKKSKDSFIRQLLFCVTVLLVITMLYSASLIAIKNARYIESIEKRGEITSQDIIYEIEELKLSSDEIEISGWIAWNNEKWEYLSVVLQDTNSLDVINCKAELEEGQDVNECFEMLEEMKCSRFTVEIKNKKVKMNTSYEVLIDISYKEVNKKGKTVYSGVKISTGRYIYNEMDYEYNPLDFIQPDIIMEEWRNVFQNGKLCDYSMEYGTWIYLYEKTIYWIIDSNKIPSLENVPSIPILMFVNRSDLIPKEQLEEYIVRGYIYDEIYLEESHYLDEESSKYYVVSYELPIEYPITYIQTGLYGNRDGIEWIFKSNFRVHTLEEMKQWQ